MHKKRYTNAREQYTADKGKEWDSKHNVFTVDMQKVIILPKMTIKNSFFVSRLVVFNETFAPLHKATNLCVLWHEAMSGRNAKDVASAYLAVIQKASTEVEHFIFWVDNCSAQNKNWVLYTSFVTMVNSEWGPKSITLKYFEPGHSFMKADYVHGGIGKCCMEKGEGSPRHG